MRDGERGFSLLEVLIVAALTVAVVLAATGAVANALHGAALADEKMALTDDALAALGDVRTLVGYETYDGSGASKARKLVGHSATMTLQRSSTAAEQITVTVVTPPGSAEPLAIATVAADGITVTEEQTLAAEAPAPGTPVEQQ